jgi:hypothetical protein
LSKTGVLLFDCTIIDLFDHPVDLCAFLVLCNFPRHYKIKDAFGTKDVHAPLAEEVVNINDIPPEEIHRVRMVILYCLRYIDEENFSVVVEHIVLT